MLSYLKAQWTDVKHGRHPKTAGETRTYEQWGKELARLVGRSRPFKKSQLTKFFKGESTPADIVDAISIYLGIPSPAIAADSIDEVEWFLVGKELLHSDPDDFRKLLRNAQDRTRLNKEISEFDQDLDSNPDRVES